MGAKPDDVPRFRAVFAWLKSELSPIDASLAAAAANANALISIAGSISPQ